MRYSKSTAQKAHEETLPIRCWKQCYGQHREHCDGRLAGGCSSETSRAPSEGAQSEGAPSEGTSSGNTSPINTPGSSSKPLVGRLTDERIRRLDELGFVWSIRDDWQKHYDELKEYKKKHGHCNVPSRYSENRRLGIWVSSMRAAYKKADPGRSAPLTQDRIDLLNQLGFTWTIRSRDTLGESWFQRLQELKAFKNKYGHCLVPSRYAEAPGLGTWVGTQRTMRKAGSLAMNEDRIRELDNLGFVWALRGSDKINEQLPPQEANYGSSNSHEHFNFHQQHGELIHENGFNAAHVLQVMQVGGHDRHTLSGLAQSSQYHHSMDVHQQQHRHQHTRLHQPPKKEPQYPQGMDELAPGDEGGYHQHATI